MRTLTKTTTAAAAVVTAAAAGVVATRLRKRQQAPAAESARHVLTVFRPLDQVNALTNLPAPLVALGDAVTIDLSAAPGGRGTEISVRRLDERVSAGDVRRALRESRSLLEIGEVLLPSRPTTEPTLLNKPLRKVTEHGREGGLL